jgi:hypothetical protein
LLNLRRDSFFEGLLIVVVRGVVVVVDVLRDTDLLGIDEILLGVLGEADLFAYRDDGTLLPC